MGEEGRRVRAGLDAPDVPAPLRELPEVHTVRRVGQRHDRRAPTDDDQDDSPGPVRFTTTAELADHQDPIETPADGEARDRHTRGLAGIGYTVPLTETCDAAQVHLMTPVNTTPANLAEAKCTEAMQRALGANGRAPSTHLADAGYMAADL